MSRFRAYRVHEHKGAVSARLETLQLDDLTAGDVTIRAHYSSVNYKDALAATGKGRIMRRFPLVGGIDVAGVVSTSADNRFKPGPDGLSLFDAMAIGTAGFTAALAIDRMEQNGLQPDQGPVIVSGASGGVGSYAIDLLSARGHEVVALTGKSDAADYLRALGADTLLDRRTLVPGERPLEQARWGAAIDTLGGTVLAWLTRTVRPWGTIASIGMAGGIEFNTTVMPFILRGISVLGITSANCPMARRRRVWQRLAADLRPAHLPEIVTEVVSLEDLSGVFERLLGDRHRGRTVLRIAGSG
jgi:NADPH2:quinone reductase